MEDDEELYERTARRSGAYSSVLNAGGMVIQWLIERRVGGIPGWPGLTSALVGLLVLGGLLALRRRPKVPVGTAAFLINAAAVILDLWITHPYYAAAPRPWRPFEANKLGAMTAALLAPNRWAGLLAIAGYGGSALLQYHLYPGGAHERLSVTEPWATVAYSIFAVGLLAYRLRGLALAQAVARARADAAILQRLARASLTLRDLANTPLQTLELSLAVLRARDDELAPILARMERALQRLHALGRALSSYETPPRRGGGELLAPASDAVGKVGGAPVVGPPGRGARS
jgi:hypothetical protein